MADHPVLVIPADTADAILATVECPNSECQDEHLGRGFVCAPALEGGQSVNPVLCFECGGTGRVPDPEAPRRLVLAERPVVPCPKCNGSQVVAGWEGEVVDCTCTEGVVPLVGGETVALTVVEWRLLHPEQAPTEWVRDHTTPAEDQDFAFFESRGFAERRQVPVAVAQVADVIEECLKPPVYNTWGAARPGEPGWNWERRWVVVLGRVDIKETA